MGSVRVTSEGPLIRPLSGTVHVGGAKNSALKLMAAALSAPGRTTLHNVPGILDVAVMGQLLERLGCTVAVQQAGQSDLALGPTGGTVVIEVPEQIGHEAPYELVRRLRASIAVLGPLVARCGRASVALPGGDAIGSRGLDMHIAGLEALGAGCRVEHGQVVAEVTDRIEGISTGSLVIEGVDRPATVRDGARGGLERHRDDHRERLRGSFHVRPGARPTRCRAAHRRSPRSGARIGTPLRCSGGGTRHPGRRCPGAGRPGGPGHHDGRRRNHIDRGYPLFIEALAEVGADVARVPERGGQHRKARTAAAGTWTDEALATPGYR